MQYMIYFYHPQQTSSNFIFSMSQITVMQTVLLPILFFSVVFKFVAMIIGVLGSITVLLYTILMSKENTVTCYLIGNLALADLLVCLTNYPIWIIKFVQTILNIDGDQKLFCNLSRSTIWSLLSASVATLLLISTDRYLYIVKPLKYPIIVTQRHVLQTILDDNIFCAHASFQRLQIGQDSKKKPMHYITNIRRYIVANNCLCCLRPTDFNISPQFPNNNHRTETT